MRVKPSIIASCDICDLSEGCCAKCCQDGDECNLNVHIPDLDPIWQFGYSRQVFNFASEDAFRQETYEEDLGQTLP